MASLFLLSLAAVTLFLYLCGYVAGSLLVSDRSSLAWSAIRIAAGLLLTTTAFLAALVVGLPWWSGPVVVLVLAIARVDRSSWVPPSPRIRPTVDGTAAAILALAIAAPVALSAARMAPGSYPPMFFSVDTAYFMEKVHALTTTDRYPPPSLSNLGGAREYHYGAHGMGALISRSTGLPPHQAVFGVVMPVFVLALLGAATAAARTIAPRVPRVLGMPLLLISIPSFWYPFWREIWAALAGGLPDGLRSAWVEFGDNYEFWGVATVEPHNFAAHFVTLAILAAYFGSGPRRWGLLYLLAGAAVLIKSQTGIGLVAGLAAAHSYEVLRGRRIRDVVLLAGLLTAFGVVYALFWLVSQSPSDYAVRLALFYHLRQLGRQAALSWFGLDFAWLWLPAMIIVVAARRGPGRSTLGLLLAALAPLVVVNLTRIVDLRPEGAARNDDWVQVLFTMTFAAHACVLSFANDHWERISTFARTAFSALVAITVIPVAAVAANYASVLVEHPEDGHEYVDNRPLGQLLRAIPAAGSVIVTNDLRYPANGFARDERQMQIPALFGHQAFAVNYAYELFPFSQERRQLQTLLRGEQWTVAITDAARQYGWTHLVIRKDYPHPASIPLSLMFENDDYAAYRFGGP